MLRRLLLKNRLSIVAPIALIAMTSAMLMLLLCSMDNPVTPPEPKWNFTLDVLNGYSGAKIPGAAVQYMKDISDTVVTTNTAGRVKIEGLSAGTQSFTISYSDSSNKYTSVVVQAASLYSADSNRLNKLTDQAKSIKLFPLSASLSGTVVSRINDMATKVPVKGALVSVTYDNADLENASNIATEAKTDSLGVFTITGLPLATGCKVTIASAKIGSIYFNAGNFTPTLVKGIVSMQEIVMSPVNAATFALKSNLPKVISPNDSIVITYSDPVDSTSNVRLEGVSGSQNVQVTARASGSNLIIVPAISLVDGSSYNLTVYAFGKAGGSVTTTGTVQVKGGGIIDVISSNVLDANHSAKDGIGLTDSMKFTFRTAITTASATVKKGDTVVLVDVSASGKDLVIKPKGSWEAGTYTVKISANLDDGKAATFDFNVATVGALNFVSSNVYNPQSGNAVMGLGFKDTIVVTANKLIASAKAILTQNGTSVPISSTVLGSTVKIKSADDLRPATSYTLTISISTVEGESKSFQSTFTTASSDFYPVADNIRFDNDPSKPVLNFQPNGTIIIKMSAAVHSATAQVTPTIPINVTWSTDTIRITPAVNLSENQAYSLRVSAESNTGTVYNERYVTDFYAQANKVFITASNVINTNGLGLTNIPITIAPYFVLSATPVEATLAVSITASGSPINATVTVSGDTVKVQPVKNLANGTEYEVSIKGKTTQNVSIDISMTHTNTNNAAFTTRQPVFIVATNMEDLEQNPMNNLLPSGELWVKFSRPLATDLTKQKLGGGAGTTASYTYGATNNNVSIRVSGDTLFAKFLPNLLPAYAAAVSLRSISIVFDDATTLTTVNLNANIIDKQKPYVLATNGMKNNVVVDTFNVLSEVWIVSSLSFRSIDLVKDIAAPVNMDANNLVPSNVRTHGDTIFFKPAIRLGYKTEYQIAFEVTLNDSTKYTGSDLKLRWKTQKGLYLVSANDMEVGKDAYRPFSVTGDSLVVVFSKPIDTTKTFAITGFTTKVLYVWNLAKTRVKVIPIDTLIAKAYTPIPDYKLNATPQYSPISITATSADGESKTMVANTAAFDNQRPALAVHTIPGIEVLNTNLKVSSINKSQMYANIDNRALSALGAAVVQNDSLNVGDTLRVYFSRAVDAAAVTTTIPHLVQLINNSNSVDQNITVWFDVSGKTMFVKPVIAMTPGTGYTLNLNNVLASGLSKIDPNALVTYSLPFKTKTLATKPVTASVVVLYADTAMGSFVNGKRLAYSGSISNAYVSAGLSSDVPAINTIKLMWKEIAFASTADTVTHYQYSVKGADGNWYDLRNLIAAVHYDRFNPLADSVYKHTLDLSNIASVTDINGADVGGALRVTANAGANQHNTPNIFNYGVIVQIKVRPVVSANAVWDAGDLSGSWSVPISLQDNVAPCDSDFVANTTTPANLTNAGKGGVAVVPAPCAINRTALTSGEYIINFTFPEDMDITMKPSVYTWYGDTTGIGAITSRISVDDAKSNWTSNNVYKMTVTIPGNVDWTPLKAYYAISVAGMKDASGQTIQTWGSTVGAANHVDITALPATVIPGTSNVNGVVLF